MIATVPITYVDCARLLGSVRSEKKAMAARENGKKGGRPRRDREAVIQALQSEQRHDAQAAG